MDLLTWLSGVDPSAVINALGLGSLAVLFATDRIKTRGQVTRELAERDRNHGLVVAALEKSQAATLAAQAFLKVVQSTQETALQIHRKVIEMLLFFAQLTSRVG